MLQKKEYKFWFCTGSQDLYGDECLAHVAEHSKIIVEELNKSGNLPFEVVWKPTLLTNELIRKTFNEANTDELCAGVITWMHTFSPAKSWILGLQELRKPLLHLHTQFNREIPYDTIDMDFMNENQSAHGDREYGHIVSRMGIERKIIVGHWANENVQKQLGSWMRTALGVIESSHIRVCRFGDNMNNVAVTEGDKVEAQIKFGWEIDAYPVNEIAAYVDAVLKQRLFFDEKAKADLKVVYTPLHGAGNVPVRAALKADGFTDVTVVPEQEWPRRHRYLTHIGVYAYRREILLSLPSLPPSSLEQAESLEQLRWLQAGLGIAVAESAHPTVGIDTPADLERARDFLNNNCLNDIAL